LFWVASCAVNPVSGETELMLLSDEREVELGRQTDREVIQEYGIYDDPDLTNYVNLLCQQLSEASHRPNLPYQAKVLDVAVVNAFAVPGGYIYFTRGILAYLNNEAELAGVMGHELGHITARHSAKQYSRAQLAQVGLGLGMILSETLRDFGELAQVGVSMLFLKFSRDNERQADALAVEYSSKVGYDATQFAAFFDTLDRMHPSSSESGLPAWFSTHPNPVDRKGAVRRNSTEWQKKLNLTTPKVLPEQYLSQIDGLVYGDDPRQGYVENTVFYHPLLRFQFPIPAAWELQNTHTHVRMESNRKDAAILFTLASGNSVEQAARAFVNKSSAAVLDSTRLQINGLPVYRLISQVRSQQGILQTMSYFIQKDDKIYVFHGLSPANLFHGYRATFENTMRGFQELTDPDKLQVKPSRIRFRSTQSPGTLRQTLKALGTPEDKLEELALLNGKHLDDPIPANTLLKVLDKD
jgi:predicted Zn-dependent protease